MRAGLLRYKATLQAPVSQQDELGGTAPGWSDVAQHWIGIQPLSGRELLRAGQAVSAEGTYEITTRWTRGIEPAMRWLLPAACSGLGQDRVFEIVSVIDVNERRRELRMTCVERV